MRAFIKNAIEILREASLYSAYTEIKPEILQKFMSIQYCSSLTGKKSAVHEIIRESAAKFAEKACVEKNLLPQEKLNSGLESKEKWEECTNLDELNKQICRCTKCRLAEGRTNFVFGEGNPKAELMFIGEGPGRDEDLQGRPFVGRAGQLLTKMIAAMGYDRNEVYIANIVKCRPPDNRVPEPDEAAACLPYLKKQIKLISPRAIVLLGATPARFLLGVKGINEARGEWFDLNGIKTMPTYHPAFLLRNPSAKAHVWQDLKLVMAFLGKEIPKEK